MASTRGLLPASKEIVLEIQLNKLIRDFLFSEVGDGNTSSLRNRDAEVQKAAYVVENHSWNVDAKPWKTDKSVSVSLENPHPSENASSLANAAGVKGPINMVPSSVDDQSGGTRLSNVLNGCSSMPPDHNNNSCPIAEEVRLDINEQTSNPCNVNEPHHANKVKVFRLSKSHSVAGSVFCFSMQRQGENKEKEGKGRAAGGSIKLTRLGSLPCHSKLCNDTEKGFKHTCRKPPRPPRSMFENSSDNVLSRHASSDAIFVLHGTSRRARSERRKRHAGASRSNASIWALIFTLLFALAMLGEGFWSQKSTLIARNSSTISSMDITMARSDMKPNSVILSTGRTRDSGPYVSSQLEKEMQMREFWMSKGLDPT